MIDEEHLRRVKISKSPLGQRMVAKVLWLTYRLPENTEIVLEGLENIPTDRGVMFALNHTDRYNYWPFQYELLRQGHPRFTLTWVKAKYYENKVLGWFFDQCNNLPLPSRGYAILKDAAAVLQRRLANDEYRVLRDLVDHKLEPDAIEGALRSSLGPLFTTPRADFRPDSEDYQAFMNRRCDRLMALVEQRSLEALHEKDNHIIVFPQGTRSVRLLPSRTGMLEFALRHQVPIVPVGSNGCEGVYPGASPWASGGRVIYRVGAPLTLDGALAGCRIDEPYRPFTQEAHVHAEIFERGAEIVTRSINALLDEPYQLGDENLDTRSRADRLM